MTLDVYSGDNLDVLARFADASFNLIYIDPPFNTGIEQKRELNSESRSYNDTFDDYEAFIKPRLEHAYRLLDATGSFFLHIDYREVHYVKVILDKIFGRQNFINEIIWSYDYGGRSKTRWSTKHDNILWYAKDHKNYCFNYDEIDRIPYLAPTLVGDEKAQRGKTPTDVWWNTIVHTGGAEKTGYPTQKPISIIKRIVAVHSRPGDKLLDFFAGSGTFGAAALELERDVVLVDQNPQAVEIMQKRFADVDAKFH